MKGTAKEIEDVYRVVLDSAGSSSRELRKAVESRAAGLSGLDEDSEVPADLEPWVEKVAKHAYKTTGSDVIELKDAGYGEDEIFELTVSAALGAARARLELAMNAVSEEEVEQNAS